MTCSSVNLLMLALSCFERLSCELVYAGCRPINRLLRMKNILVVGSSGHARVVIDIIEQQGSYKIAGLLDRNRPVGETTMGYNILGSESNIKDLRDKHKVDGIIVAIGDNSIRSDVAETIYGLCPDLDYVSAIHPRATIGRDVSIGDGTVIMAGAVINPCCSIGRGCIINTTASLDHDSVMGDFSSLAPGAITGGNCVIGQHAAISIGATLLHGISVGEHTVIGAGATVLENIDAYKMAHGIPAKVVRERKAGDKYL